LQGQDHRELPFVDGQQNGVAFRARQRLEPASA
jgi:hypothetical protein